MHPLSLLTFLNQYSLLGRDACDLQFDAVSVKKLVFVLLLSTWGYL